VDGRTVTSKLAAILRSFSEGRLHSLSEVARSADIPVSTAHRLVSELVEWGFLDRTPDKRYGVGSLLTQIGGSVWHVPRIQNLAEQVLDDLASAVNATVRFGMLHGGTVVGIESRSTRVGPSRYRSCRLPAHATAVGKVLLAYSETESVNDVIRQGMTRFTTNTIVTAAALRRDLAITRMNQLAWAREELEPETTSIAAPVFAVGGRVVAALEVTVGGASHEFRARTAQPALVVAARGMTRQLATSRSLQSRAIPAVDSGTQFGVADGRLA
jgi:IclR family acetate operon transcriptional repressor